jgi:hypothetical protein
MTEDERIFKEVKELRRRVEELEEDRDKLLNLPEALAEVKGMVVTLQGLITSGFDGIKPGIEKASSVKTAITFASVVLVPIIVALIGGYFVLQAGAK